MPKIKISQLPAKAANLAATDLLEVSEVSGLTYVSKKITGTELVGNRVPYIGATQDVDLGEYELKAGQIELDQSPTGTAGVAVTRWNDTIGATETTLKGGNVVLKNGVDLVARVVNKVTPNTTLTKAAYKVVKISGAIGQRLAVEYAQANNDNNSADTLGVVCDTIATNQEGFIMTMGQLEEINTTGSLQGETWADGDVLYLSPTTPGNVTKAKPTGATGHIVVIGYVEHAHAVHGKIYVKIMNGWELDELHNVYIDNGTLANNQVLTYESATQLWKNKTPETGITVGTTPVTSGTDGRVFFQAGGVVQQDAGFLWDTANKRMQLLGTGVIASPALNSVLEIKAKNGLSDIAFRVRNSADTADLFSIRGNKDIYLPSTGGGTNVVRIYANADDAFGPNTLLTYGRKGSGNIAINESSTFAVGGFQQTAIGIGAAVSADGGVSLGDTATVDSGATNGIAIGKFSRGFGSNFIAIGTGPATNQTYGGSNTIVLGNRTGGFGININNVFFTYFASNNVTTITRDNGSFGLLGQQMEVRDATQLTNNMGNGGNTLVVMNHTAVPSTNIANAFQLYSNDITAGNAAPHFRTEVGDIIKLYKNAAVTTPQGIADALTNLGVLTASTIAPSVQSVVSAATVTPAAGNDLVKITAQAVGLTLANPTGTWAEGQDLMIRIKDDGLGARAITWDTNYRAIGVTLPTTTVLGKTTYVGVIYNSTDSKWDVISVTTQA